MAARSNKFNVTTSVSLPIVNAQETLSSHSQTVNLLIRLFIRPSILTCHDVHPPHPISVSIYLAISVCLSI